MSETSTEVDNITYVEGHSGAAIRKCSKCQLPCKHHPGPYGSQCSVNLEDMSHTEDNTSSIGATGGSTGGATGGAIQEPDSRMEHLLRTMVSQMSSLNTNFNAMLQGQQDLKQTVLDQLTPPAAFMTSRPRRPEIQSNTLNDRITDATNSLVSSPIVLPGGARISEKTSKAAKDGVY